MDPPQWYAGLATFYVTACLFITDPADRVLVVKPNYRPGWSLPGGVAEEGERPDRCAEREISEELGLALPAGELLAVDWVPPLDQRPRAALTFVFDGGVLDDPGAIRLQDDELDEFAFLPWREAADLLPEITAPRLVGAWRGRQERRTVYLPLARD